MTTRGRGKPFAVLDIGSTKMVCFIARLDVMGKPKIIGIGHQFSQGIRAGLIVDIKAAESSILACVSAAEKMAGETIEHVIVNVPGNIVASQRVSVETMIGGDEISDRDIHEAALESYQHITQGNRQVIHAVPIEYAVDNVSDVEDPRGMFGEKLSTHFHMITVTGSALKNLSHCLARARLNVDEYVCSVYASALVTLTHDEKNLGCTLIDMGGGNTSIATFISGRIVHVDNVALGGLHITRDLARGLSTSLSFAERVKTLHGSTMITSSDSSEILDLPVDSELEGQENEEPQRITKETIISIIRPRIEETFEMVKKSLETTGMDNVAGRRIVLTGGASQLQGVKELAAHILDKQVRLGRPIQFEGLAESTKGPVFSTAIGMLYYATEKDGIIKMHEFDNIRKGLLKKIFRWL